MSDRPVDPYRRHRFDVDIGDDRPPLGFTAVDGLSVRVETRSADGSAPEHAVGRTLPATRRRTASPTLTLRRGITDDRRLWEWLRDWVDGAVEPRDVRVFLLDATGERARGWRCRAATPVRWGGPALAADRPAAATEALELAHEGIEAITGDEYAINHA